MPGPEINLRSMAALPQYHKNTLFLPCKNQS